jgi:hypothetical protein
MRDDVNCTSRREWRRVVEAILELVNDHVGLAHDEPLKFRIKKKKAKDERWCNGELPYTETFISILYVYCRLPMV